MTVWKDPVEITDVVARGLARRIQRYARRPIFGKWLGSYLDSVQKLESATFEVLTSRLIDNAIGKQLAILSAIVGEPVRFSDPIEQRIAVKARACINVSQGLYEDIRTLMSLILRHEENGILRAAAYLITLHAQTVFVYALETLDHNPNYAADYLKETAAAGVRTQLIYPVVALDDTFAFSWISEPENDRAFGWTDGTLGGKMAGVAT
jgi:hypothetical protein